MPGERGRAGLYGTPPGVNREVPSVVQMAGRTLTCVGAPPGSRVPPPAPLPPSTTFIPESTTTMRIQSTPTLLAGALLASSLLLAAAPASLLGQDTPAEGASQASDTVTAVDKPEMVHFVELQLEIEALREEAIQEMVRIHSEDGRASIRNNLTEAIREAHEAHEMTPERYKTITFLISSDTPTRELFEETLAEIREAQGGGA